MGRTGACQRHTLNKKRSGKQEYMQEKDRNQNHTLSAGNTENATGKKSKTKKGGPVDVSKIKPEEMLKYEIAKELGLYDKVIANGWRSLTAKESGRIGGIMTRRRAAQKQAAKDRQVQ